MSENNWTRYEPCPNCGSKELMIEYIALKESKVNDDGEIIEEYNVTYLAKTEDEPKAVCPQCGSELY